MYTPINDRLIVRKPAETKTDSGIFISETDAFVKTLEVFRTNEPKLEGKTILVERRHFEDFGDGYGAVKIENIMAIKDGTR